MKNIKASNHHRVDRADQNWKCQSFLFAILRVTLDQPGSGFGRISSDTVVFAVNTTTYENH